MRRNYEDLMHSDGTTAYETFIVIVPSVFIIFIASLIVLKFFRRNVIQQLIAEFVLIIIPLILIVTALADYCTNILILLIIISITLIGFFKSGNNFVPVQKRKNYNYITLARCITFYLTVIGILAVDFEIFPRRFSKTKNYGYSLMDVGVGLYVFSSGMLSNNRLYGNSIKKSVVTAIPLIVLGCGRFVLTKEIDYQVIDSEYGVHWNFFITLATVQIVSSVILNFINIGAIYIGGTLLLLHESLLQLGLGQYLLTDMERNTFFKANREGIISSLGYLGLYFLSVGIGKFLEIKRHNVKFSWKLCFKYASLISFLLWATFILEKNFGISRRLANSGYCIWIIFIGVFMLGLMYMLELLENLICGSVYVPVLFEAVNYNSLIFFLVANLLTGAVNITFHTFSMSGTQSLIILTFYMIINCIVMYILFINKIKLK